ncbi:uncharacterized protein LOC144711780 isoform X2 [Wolffia australiana]
MERKKDFSEDEGMGLKERRSRVTKNDRFGETIAWKTTDEMIGVSIPRKARSAHAKRASTSQQTPSDASIRKKKKKLGRNKPKTTKLSKSPSSIQEIEIEVAEVLFGLTKQFQANLEQDSSKKLNNDEDKHINVEGKKLEDGSNFKATECDQRMAELQSPMKSNFMQSESGENSIDQGMKLRDLHDLSMKGESVYASGLKGKRLEEKKHPISDDFITKLPESGVKRDLATDDTEEKLDTDSMVTPRRVSMGNFSQEKIMDACKTQFRGSESKRAVEEHDSQVSVRKNSSDVAELDTFKENEDENNSKPEPASEKTPALCGALPIPMVAARWPAGPQFGYMAHIAQQPNGPVEGSGSSNLPVQKIRMKRCAIHRYIAQNIFFHQHIAQMSPFWPMAAANAYNLNFNSLAEATQKKQQLPQHPVLAGSANSMMRGPALQGEAQYVLLQNNNYRFPVPSFRPSNHPQQMAFLNPAFYGSHMFHHRPMLHESASDGPKSKRNKIPLHQPLQNIRPEAVRHPSGSHGFGISSNGPAHNEKSQLLPHTDNAKSLPDKLDGPINGGKVSAQPQMNNFTSAIPGFPFGLWENSPRPGVLPTSSAAQSVCTAKNSPTSSSTTKASVLGKPNLQSQMAFAGPNLQFKNLAVRGEQQQLLQTAQFVGGAAFSYMGMPPIADRPDRKHVAGVWDKPLPQKSA